MRAPVFWHRFTIRIGLCAVQFWYFMYAILRLCLQTICDYLINDYWLQNFFNVIGIISIYCWNYYACCNHNLFQVRPNANHVTRGMGNIFYQMHYFRNDGNAYQILNLMYAHADQYAFWFLTRSVFVGKTRLCNMNLDIYVL